MTCTVVATRQALGGGWPRNVHQVAQRFTPDARVVYVDIDPIVLAYGRFSQIVCSDAERAADLDTRMNAAGIPWQNRTREQVNALVQDGLEPVEPGLVNLLHWRPDPDQPPLPPVPDELTQFVGASKMGRDMCEYGGILRKP